MPPWRQGILEERVERCRALLADPTCEHHGSADMECFVQHADLMVALHKVALDDSNKPRTDLTEGEQLQAEQLCALWVLAEHKHPITFVALNPAVDDMIEQAAKALPQRWDAVAYAALLLRLRPTLDRMAELQFKRRVGVQAVMTFLDRSPEAAAALPDDMAAAGCSHTLTAAVLKQAALYCLVVGVVQEFGAAMLKGQAAQPDPDAVQGARRAADSLVALRPGWPRYLLLRADVAAMARDFPAAAADWRAARQAAEAQRAYYWASEACRNLAASMMRGMLGNRRFEPRQVQELVDAWERMERLARPWTAPAKQYSSSSLKAVREMLRESVAAAAPGASSVPVLFGAPSGSVFRALLTPRCNGCRQECAELKKCSRCRAVAYCSRECQLRHWKEGGHKRECKPE